MHEKRTFSVDSRGSAEQIITDTKREAYPSGTRIIFDDGEHGIPMGKGESVIFARSGNKFLVRPTEQRVYDVSNGTWHELPEGIDPKEYVDGLN